MLAWRDHTAEVVICLADRQHMKHKKQCPQAQKRLCRREITDVLLKCGAVQIGRMLPPSFLCPSFIMFPEQKSGGARPNPRVG